MKVHRSLMATLIAGSLTLVACGGDDEPVLDSGTADSGTATAESGTGTATADAGGGDAGSAGDTDSTLPEELQVASRTVEVTGDPLPPMPSDGSDDPAIGMTAPILAGEGYDGTAARVDAVASGPTMVVFFAHWCPHCNNEIPRINELRDDGAFPPELRIVGVSTGYRPDYPNYPPGEWLERLDWTYPVIADQLDISDPAAPVYVAGNAFGLAGYPYTVLIDGDGVVVDRWSGEKGADMIPEIESALGL